MSEIQKLTAVLNLLCPIDGCASVDVSERNPWADMHNCAIATLPDGSTVRLDFRPEATTQEREAAIAAAAVYDPELAPEPGAAPINLAEYTAARRYQIEIAGIVSQTFGPLLTDRGTRAIIGQTIQSIDLGIVTAPINFKSPAGFVSLTRAQLIAIAAEITAHVHTCFDAEQAVLAGIVGETITTAAEVDAAFAAELV